MKSSRSFALGAVSLWVLTSTLACSGGDLEASSESVGTVSEFAPIAEPAAEAVQPDQAGASTNAVNNSGTEQDSASPSLPLPAAEPGVGQQATALSSTGTCDVQVPLVAGGVFPMGCDDAGFHVSPTRLCCPESASGLWATSSDAQGLRLNVFFESIQLVCELPGTYQVTWGYGDCATVQTFEFTCVVSPLGVPGDACVSNTGNAGIVECGGHGMRCSAPSQN
jgi:hypothetical protein